MGRTLALDVGERRTGAAVSDELGITAQPAGVWERTGYKSDLAGVQGLMEEYEIDALVVGHPVSLGGATTLQTEQVRSVAKKLARALPSLAVYLWDERLTTALAERSLIEADISRKKRKKVIDQMAAQLILQSWLDRGAGAGEKL